MPFVLSGVWFLYPVTVFRDNFSKSLVIIYRKRQSSHKNLILMSKSQSEPEQERSRLGREVSGEGVGTRAS